MGTRQPASPDSIGQAPTPAGEIERPNTEQGRVEGDAMLLPLVRALARLAAAEVWARANHPHPEDKT